MNTETDRKGHDESETGAESATETAVDIEIDTDADINALDEGEWVDVCHPLYDMTSTPLASGDGGAAVEVLKAFLEAHDRKVWIDEIGNVRAPTDGAVLLTSYVDTVPGDVPVKAEDDVLWGHDSVDATDPLYTMTVAAIETGVSFVGVVNEETSSRGVWHPVEDREEFDAVVNGESSGWDGATLGYRGFLSGTYVLTSELGHSSCPEGDAIQSTAAWRSRAIDFFDEDRNDIFDTVTIKPVTFDDGPTEDGSVVKTTMDMQFRVSPRLSIDDVREVVESELTRGGAHWNRPIPPVMMGPHIDMARVFRVAIRNAGDVKPRLLREAGTSDMNIFVGIWNCPITTYSPGNSDLDHVPGEHLDLAEFDSAIDVSVDVCERLVDD